MKKIVIASMIAAASLGLAACKKDAPIDTNTTSNELVTNETDVTVANLDAPVDANATVDANVTVTNETTTTNTVAK
ncbi:MAG: hypothetical protein JWL96_586 [Sphingomonas bacterium]|uniref:hypothetical protein n=1 Tax=Sphingomonas bacterium TaxID=1895847 RepID=UPI0026393482|nr:hypothetical protein [Sphingomonas bacterium]MDB5708516.1 hypothetical protein [Sphingomonas bacterium]